MTTGELQGENKQDKARVRSTEPVEYVVQQRVDVDLEPDDPWAGWRDVDTVVVPAGSKKRTALEKALEGVDPGARAGVYRVLSLVEAREFTVRTVTRDPELVIEGGGA